MHRELMMKVSMACRSAKHAMIALYCPSKCNVLLYKVQERGKKRIQERV